MLDTPVKFVILSQPRTGSTLVCSYLNGVQGCRCLVEPLNHTSHQHHMKAVVGSKCLLPEPMLHNNLVRALNILFREAAPPEQWIKSRKMAKKAAGFKIMIHQLQTLRSESVFWSYLVENTVKVIVVLRRNMLMQYISDLIVRATRQCACWDGKVRTTKVLVATETLGADLRKIEAEKVYLWDKLESLKLPFKLLEYEDFQHDQTPVGVVLDWLIGEQTVLTTKLHKQNPDTLWDRVVNYDDVVRTIRQLGYTALLEGV